MLRERVRDVAERFAPRLLPRGVSPFLDLRRGLGGFSPSVIFDVGANLGQSALVYTRACPQATIHSFEPVPATFKQLSQNVAGNNRIRVHQIALGADAGTVAMAQSASSDRSRIVEFGASDSVAVNLSTLDRFCDAEGITAIDYLKIDTEGHDLAVLHGSASMLGNGAVAAFEVEAGMHPENDLHVPFEELKSYAESMDYRCFGLYEQTEEWTTGDPWLRRVNALFIPRSR